MENKRCLIDLCLKAGRRRLSALTGFVHLHHDPGQNQQQTVPLFENFCYVLGLFRSRLSEDVAEGKALLERLLSFEVEGNFPVYIHEFPECRNRNLSSEIIPILGHIDRQFRPILGEALKDKLASAMERIRSFVETNRAKYPHFAPEIPRGSADLSRRLLEGQTHDAASSWHPGLGIYIGPQGKEPYHGPYPAPTLYDLFMAEWSGVLPDRLKNDHPIHLLASLVFPFEEPFTPQLRPVPFLKLQEQTPIFTLFWGDAQKPHSLVVQEGKTKCSYEEGIFSFQLPETFPEENEAMEFGFFLNLDPDHQVTIEGGRATTFRLGETIEIRTKGELIATLCFFLQEGEGDFFGHLARGNRPRQTANGVTNRYEAYDLSLSLRTVARSSLCSIGVSVGLSTASPMACIPLST